MKPQPQLSIIMPAYNEEHIMASNILRVFDYFSTRVPSFEIIVVDDGSTDNTLREAQSLLPQVSNLRVLAIAVNTGKGNAVRYGMLNAYGSWVLFTDIDLSTPLEEYSKYTPHMTDYDIIIGSRGMTESDIIVSQPLYKVIIGKLGNKLVRLLLGLPYKDTQCGFKLFKRSTTTELFQKQLLRRWGFDFEILYMAHKKQLKIIEIPIRWSDDGKSAVKKLAYLSTLKELLAVRLNDLRGLYK